MTARCKEQYHYASPTPHANGPGHASFFWEGSPLAKGAMLRVYGHGCGGGNATSHCGAVCIGGVPCVLPDAEQKLSVH